MIHKTSRTAAFVTGAVLLIAALQATPQQPAAPSGTCDTFKRLAVVQQGSRKLVTEAGGLSVAGKDVSPTWIERIQAESRLLNASAEKLATTAAAPEPEAGFNLGKHMNGVRDLLADSGVAAARGRNATLDNFARTFGALSSDAYALIRDLGKLKDEAARCGPRKAS
jgi:hypothetical protein